MKWKVADRVLLQEIDGRLRTAYERAGDRMVCRPGCSECCIGLFTINQLDARRLRRGLEELKREDPTRAVAVTRRARAVVELVSDKFPGDQGAGVLDPDDSRTDAFVERFARVACPALDPASQRCDLYSHRPLSCRTYGPPVKLNEDHLPCCALCFKGASAKEIEECRIDPDPDGLEHAILCELTGTGAPSGETIVAHALLAPQVEKDDRTHEC